MALRKLQVLAVSFSLSGTLLSPLPITVHHAEGDTTIEAATEQPVPEGEVPAENGIPVETDPSVGIPLPEGEGTQPVTEAVTEAPVTETPVTEEQPAAQPMGETLESATGETGTLQIMYGYMFNDGSYDPWISVPGVAVGKNTLLADDVFDVVRTDSPIYQKILTERKEGYASLHVDLTNTEAVKQGCMIMIYDGSDYLKHGNMQIRETANGTNYTVITTEESLNRYGRFSPLGIELGQEVYAVGFSTSIMDTSHYAEVEDILEQKVSITGLNEDGTISFITDSSENFCALVNKDGEVLGLISDITNGSGRAVAAVDIESYLDEIQVKYYVGEQKSPILNTGLKNAIKDAEALNKNDYTEESYDYMMQAVNSGKKTLKNENATQEEIDRAENDIINAMNKLEDAKSGINIKLILLIIVGVAALVGTVMAAVIVTGKQKKAKLRKIKKSDNNDAFAPSNAEYSQTIQMQEEAPLQRQPAQQKQTVSATCTQAADTPAMQTVPQQQKLTFTSIEQRPVPIDYEAGTSVLTEDMANPGAYTKQAYLIRELTGEQIPVNISPFTIGKSIQACYQIKNNEAISRIHCRIAWLNGELCIFDNDSTNHTYVHGHKIATNTPYPLTDGDMVRLANENFMVRIV